MTRPVNTPGRVLTKIMTDTERLLVVKTKLAECRHTLEKAARTARFIDIRRKECEFAVGLEAALEELEKVEKVLE